MPFVELSGMFMGDAALCDPLTGRCVECRDGLDCGSGLCDPLAQTCLPDD